MQEIKMNHFMINKEKILKTCLVFLGSDIMKTEIKKKTR